MVALALAAAGRHHLDGDHVMMWKLNAEPTAHWLDYCGERPPEDWPVQLTSANTPVVGGNGGRAPGSLQLPLPFTRMLGTKAAITGGDDSDVTNEGRFLIFAASSCDQKQTKAKLWPQIGPLLWHLGVSPQEAQEVIGAALDLGLIRGVFDDEAVNPISASLKERLLPEDKRTPDPFLKLTVRNSKYQYVTRAVEAMSGDVRKLARVDENFLRGHYFDESLYHADRDDWGVPTVQGWDPSAMLMEHVLYDANGNPGTVPRNASSAADMNTLMVVEIKKVVKNYVQSWLVAHYFPDWLAEPIAAGVEHLVGTTAGGALSYLLRISSECVDASALQLPSVDDYTNIVVQKISVGSSFVDKIIQSIVYQLMHRLERIVDFINDKILSWIGHFFLEFLYPLIPGSGPLCLSDNGLQLDYQLGMVAWGFHQCRSLGLTLGDDCDFTTIVDNAVIGNEPDIPLRDLVAWPRQRGPYGTRTEAFGKKDRYQNEGLYGNIHLEEPDLSDKMDNYFHAIKTAHENNPEFDAYKDFFGTDDRHDVFHNFYWRTNTPNDLDGGVWMAWPVPCHWLWMLFGDCRATATEVDIVLQLFGYAPPSAYSIPGVRAATEACATMQHSADATAGEYNPDPYCPDIIRDRYDKPDPTRSPIP